MLFSRSLRTKLPLAAEHLILAVVSPRGQLRQRQEQYKKYFDRKTKALLHSDDVVRVKHHSEWLRGRVIRPHDAPRSYVVECEEGSTLRRNRRDLIKTAEETPVCAPFIDEPPPTQDASPSSSSPPPPSPLLTSSSSAVRPPLSILKTTSRGRVAQQPVRFADYDMSAGRRRK